MKEKKLLTKSEVPPIFQQPYITSAYRRPYCGPLQCIKYAFTLHNDVGNFWTHFVTLIVWLMWLPFIMRDYDLSTDYNAPLLCYWIGCCSYVLFSSVAHMFSPLSDVMCHVCWMLDYAGISIYMYMVGLAYYYYERPLTLTFYKWEYLHLTVQTGLTIPAFTASSLSRFYWGRYQHFIRAVTFIPAFLSDLVTVLLRWSECHSEECIPSSVPYHACMISCCVLFILVFIIRIPERFAPPGKFDVFFQSHQLFHVLNSIATTALTKLLLVDSRERQAILTEDAKLTGVFPSAYKVYGLFLTTLTVKLCIILVLWVLLHKGVIKGNKQISSEHDKSS